MIGPALGGLSGLLLATSVAFAFVASDEELSQRILGVWGEDEACAKGTLAFRSDGTFTFSLPGGHTISGTWSITDGVLTGTRQNGVPPPAVTIAFTDADTRMTMTETQGSQRGGTYHRCVS
jgi:hypothetical protein